jgi:hypothetical protein
MPAYIRQQLKTKGVTRGNTVIFDSYSSGSEVRDINLEKFSSKFLVSVDASHVSVILCAQTVQDYLPTDRQVNKSIFEQNAREGQAGGAVHGASLHHVKNPVEKFGDACFKLFIKPLVTLFARLWGNPQRLQNRALVHP